MKELELKVIEWASNRGLLFEDNAKNQLLKSFEEMGELASALRFLMDSYKQKITELESKIVIMIKDFKKVSLSIATAEGNRDVRVKYYEDVIKYIDEKYTI